MTPIFDTRHSVPRGDPAPDRPGTDRRVGRPELAAAVSNTSGLGMVSVTWDEPEEIKAKLAPFAN